jgi:VIT1/CCC1 family predicted Fe2+/Mn2+ transporter
MPLLVAYIIPANIVTLTIAATSLLFLAVLGATAARTGGAPVFSGAARVTFWGALAMAITYGVGLLFGTVV